MGEIRRETDACYQGACDVLILEPSGGHTGTFSL